jgi:hypothetical protein
MTNKNIHFEQSDTGTIITTAIPSDKKIIATAKKEIEKISVATKTTTVTDTTTAAKKL